MSADQKSAPAGRRIRQPGRRAEDRSVRLYFDYALTGILETDATGRIFRANPAAASITGRPPQLLIERKLVDLIDPASTARLARHLALLAEQGIGQAEFGIVRHDASRITVTLASVQIDEARFMHVFDDVTEQRRVEAEIRAARAAAEEANRTKDDFIANVSHEIRTPLNGIIGIGELALRGAENPQQQDYIEKILHSGRTLLRLVNDLLDTAKIEAGKIDFEAQPFALEALFADLADLRLQAEFEKYLDIRFDIAPDLPRRVLGDRLRFAQCLRNLLGNAIKFTDRGAVSLSFDGDGPDDAKRLRCLVRDTGIGISADVLERLFKPFSQADTSTTRRFGGTGLGLFITRELARGMGGELTAASAPGEGSCFTLSLPLRPAPDAPDELPVMAAADIPREFAGLCVLLAEDNPINQTVASHWLSRAGIHCLLATDGAQVLRQLADAATAPALILMDAQMPGMDGLEATRRLREQGYTLPIVGLSAGVSSREQEACLAAGMSDFLGKPIDLDELWGCLTRWLPPAAAPARAVDTVEQRFLGEAGLLVRARRAFVESHADDAVHLKEALAADDVMSARRRAHALRGAAATLGLEALAQAATEFERLLDKSHEEIAGRAGALHERLVDLIREGIAGFE